MSPRADSMIDRIVDILEAFRTSSGSLTASDVARRTGIPMPSAHRIVADLVRTGMLERTPDNRLRIGTRLWEVTARSSTVLTLREIALPFMEDLFAIVREPTLLSVLDRNDVVNLETLVPRTHSTVNVTRPGVRLPALASSPGIVLAAFAPAEVREQLLQHARLTRFTPHTVMDRPALERILDEARRSSSVIAARWISMSSIGIAVPVLREDGTALAALSVTVPYDGGVPAHLVPALRTTARGIARAVRAGSTAADPELALLRRRIRRATQVR